MYHNLILGKNDYEVYVYDENVHNGEYNGEYRDKNMNYIYIHNDEMYYFEEVGLLDEY